VFAGTGPDPAPCYVYPPCFTFAGKKKREDMPCGPLALRIRASSVGYSYLSSLWVVCVCGQAHCWPFRLALLSVLHQCLSFPSGGHLLSAHCGDTDPRCFSGPFRCGSLTLRHCFTGSSPSLYFGYPLSPFSLSQSYQHRDPVTPPVVPSLSSRRLREPHPLAFLSHFHPVNTKSIPGPRLYSLSLPLSRRAWSPAATPLWSGRLP